VRANSVGFLMKKTFSHCVIAAAFFVSSSSLTFGQLVDQEVVVTATRVPQKLSDSISDITVIDRAFIDSSSFTTVTELLGSQPGIQAVTHGPYGSTNVRIRGSESRMTSVYIDGVRIDSQDGVFDRLGGGMPWDLVSLDSIERIEILKGPASSIYGSDAMGGVIQIFTRQSKIGERTYASVGYGTYGTSRESVGFSSKKDKFDYSINISQENSSGRNTYPSVVHLPGKESSHSLSGNARLGLQIDNNQSLESTLIHNEVNLKSVDPSFSYCTFDCNVKTKLNVSAIKWTSNWTTDYQTKLSYSEAIYSLIDDYEQFKTTSDTVLFENNLKLPEGFLTFGLENRAHKFTQPYAAYNSSFSGSRNQSALMAGYAYKYKAHSVQLNVRNDQVGLYGSKTSPGINYGMQVSSNIKANFSAATGFRAPTLEQLYSTYGSTSLKPETNRNKELGIIYRERDTSLKAVLYRNEFRNLISTNSSFYYYNVNVATVKGLTLSGSGKVWGYQLRGSYDLLNAKDGSDKALNLRAQHQATLGVDKSIGEWKLGGEWMGVGHRYYNASNSVPLSGYGLLNAITSFQINSEYKAIFRLNNLADKKYHQIAGYDASGNLSGYYSPPGRNLFVSLNWQPK